jgi:hypothetical protein
MFKKLRHQNDLMLQAITNKGGKISLKWRDKPFKGRECN